MKIYLKNNVFDEALERIRFVFDEFDTVGVNISTGKDSTIALEMALIVAREKNRLPLDVFWLDQEYEWTESQRYAERLLERPEVRFHWMQIPSLLGNAFDPEAKFARCWWPEDEPARQPNPKAVHDGDFGSNRFKDLLDLVPLKMGVKAMITGVRAEESRTRAMATTSMATYKGVTWGGKNPFNKDFYRFHPMYDWSYKDVWTAIAKNKWDYNKIYDRYFELGLPISEWRLSSLIHEQSFRDIFIMQMVDKDMYEAMTKKLGGISTGKNLGFQNVASFSLPSWFPTWEEFFSYIMYHKEELHIDDEYYKLLSRAVIVMYRTMFNTHKILTEKKLVDGRKYREHLRGIKEKVMRDLCKAALLNDFENYRINNTEKQVNGECYGLAKKFGLTTQDITIAKMSKDSIIKSLYFFDAI